MGAGTVEGARGDKDQSFLHRLRCGQEKQEDVLLVVHGGGCDDKDDLCLETSHHYHILYVFVPHNTVTLIFHVVVAVPRVFERF
jgi:hypothetical protein